MSLVAEALAIEPNPRGDASAVGACLGEAAGGEAGCADESSPVPVATARGRVQVSTLAESVVILLVMTVLQRLIGFGRGMLFCRWLDTEQLGLWDVAYGFLNLAAPVVVLGLPGSFGRYVEYYRQRGQLRTFLARIIGFTLAAMTASTAAILALRGEVGQIVFNRPDQGSLIFWLAVAMCGVIAFNTVTLLLIALRLHRLVNHLQFFQSLGFAGLSLALFVGWQMSAGAALLAFGISSLVCATATLGRMGQVWQEAPAAEETLSHRAMWVRVMPFALWMWVNNALYNLFDLVDRYMLLHTSGLEPHEALRQVGNYHTSRILPVLMMSVAALLGSMLTPHLSHDWELGRRREVCDRLNMALKLLSLALLAAGVGALLVAPALFYHGFENKYAAGLAVLPWTLTYCSWFGLFAVAQNYLWCAERAGRASLALLLGLMLNVALNYVFLPLWGLHGAVWAATVANGFTLAAVYLFCAASGMRVHRGTWLLSLAPITLGAGWPLALPILLVLATLAASTEWLFNAPEKAEMTEALRGLAARLAKLRRRDPDATNLDSLPTVSSNQTPN